MKVQWQYLSFKLFAFGARRRKVTGEVKGDGPIFKVTGKVKGHGPICATATYLSIMYN